MSKYCEYYREWMWVVGACCMIRNFILKYYFFSSYSEEEKTTWFILNQANGSKWHSSKLWQMLEICYWSHLQMHVIYFFHRGMWKRQDEMKGIENIVQRIWIVGSVNYYELSIISVEIYFIFIFLQKCSNCCTVRMQHWPHTPSPNSDPHEIFFTMCSIESIQK